MGTATPKSIIVYVDDERVELTGKDAIEYEETRVNDHQNYLDRQAKKEKDAVEKAALLAKLGITPEEASLLLK